jgi:hypothetical protein
VEDCVHIIRSAYPGITEKEILWLHDWHWIHATIDRIQTDRREERRWGLLALYHSGAATGMAASEKTAKNFNSFYDSLKSEAEEAAAHEWEMRQREEELRKQNSELQPKVLPDGSTFGVRTVTVQE